MRLPGLVNTKPERGGACVSIIEFEPERRYPLSAFEWLAVTPEPPKIGIGFSPTNTEGHAPLPQATLAYLSQGAPQGTRNKALFDAACQLRDAGFSQTEAEAQLVARYVADGSGETGREREATATIASAYTQSPRDPLPLPRQAVTPPTTAREQLDTLMAHYVTTESKTEPPTAEQIAEMVRACAALDPIAWAAERKRIRAIAGEDYRLADLDRMYKRAQKDAYKATLSSGAPADAEHYFIEDGCMVYERHTERGKSRQVVASWSGHILEWVTAVDDDGQTGHIMRLELAHSGHTLTLDVPSELFGDANALTRFIAGRAGGLYTVRAGMNKHLVPALLSLSGEPVQKTTYRFMGWTKIDGQWTYVAPNTSVNTYGYISQPPTVELETRLRDYGLANAEWLA